MYTCLVILLERKTVPFCKCPCLVKVQHFGEGTLNDFQALFARFNVIPPHCEAQSKFSAPKTINAALHDIELAILVVSYAFGQPYLLGDFVEIFALPVTPSEKNRHASVLLY